jgi:AcrR family transcriptional regulator
MVVNMPRPRARDYQELRRALVDAGGRLLAREGPQALTTRRVAQEAGTSTTAVYNLFGDKAGLALAMFLEGFARLSEAFAAVPRSDDPVADLLALGRAYRANARGNPHLYELMFGRPIPGFAPDQAAIDQTLGSYHDLVHTIERCIDAHRLAPADPHDVAVQLHALVHGLASFELRGSLGTDAEADRRWEAALHAAVRGHQAGRP